MKKGVVAADDRQRIASMAEAKKKLIELAAHVTVAEATRQVGRSQSTYELWRKNDPDFKAAVDKAQRIKRAGKSRVVPDFPEFCAEFLDQPLNWHQLQWFDVLEGREPRDLHPAQMYEAGDPGLTLVNVPPGHAKTPLALDTEVLTSTGWSTMGELRPGDQVFGADGKPTTVVAKSEVVHRDCYRVTVSGGESFVATGDHPWTIQSSRYECTDVTTTDLKAGDFLPKIEPLHMEPVDLPLDPYLLGAWLGDGHTADGRFTTADAEIVEAFAEFQPHRIKGTPYTYGTLGLYRILAGLGVRGAKFVPQGYLLGSYEQRLALLQGLMDTDGTISAGGAASFTSTNVDLARGVQYLASSLGLRPTFAEGRASIDGRDCGPKWTVSFSPYRTPVFRLPRKLDRQRCLIPGSQGGPRLRRIVSVEPVASVPAQCIAVDNDSHLFLIGRGLVPTHNTTITQNYVAWRIVKDPNIRVLLVSKSQRFAEKLLYGIKQRLTGPRYRGLQVAFGPDGGYAATAEQWTSTQIYLGDKDDGEKDPTVAALGIGGQIYGARADLIIVDDAVVLANARQYEEHALWITQEVMSRLVGQGMLLVVGTRVAPHDLYKELRQQFEGEWTYFASPAILEDTGDPETTVTLWPKTNVPCGCKQICVPKGYDRPDENGTYPKWDGPHLLRVRRSLYAGSWSLTYQQADVAENQTFPEAAVTAALNKQRTPGMMTDGYPGHREGGIDGLHIIASMDPALSGSCASFVVGVDIRTGKRWILDLHNEAGMTPKAIHDHIKLWTEKYAPREWRIEKNAMQGMLTQDEDLRLWLAARGCRIVEHTTGSNKWDPDYGVAGMAPLFLPALDGHEPLVDIPANSINGGNASAAVRAFVAQLVAWRPKPAGEITRRDKPGTTDLVMAFWFADVRARELLLSNKASRSFTKNPFHTRRDIRNQRVIDINALLEHQANRAKMVV